VPDANVDNVVQDRDVFFVGAREKLPGSVEPRTLLPAPNSQNCLATSMRPPHAGTTESLDHECLACRFDDTRSDGQVVRAQGCVAHRVSMTTKVIK